MRATERNILIAVVSVVLIAAFYFLLLSPKREKVSELGNQVSELQASVASEEQRADAAEQAKDDFPVNYRKIVLLGKAAPDWADSASFLFQLSDLAENNHVGFEALSLVEGGTPATPSATQPGIESAPPASSQPSSTAPTPEPGTTSSPDSTQTASANVGAIPATEAAASTVPIGAGVGPAGLNTLKYDLSFTGSYFDVADFMAGVDSLVSSSGGHVSVNGRLSTVDGFSLAPNENGGLDANLTVTTYTVPANQGLTAGATPSGPTLSGSTPQLAATEGAAP